VKSELSSVGYNSMEPSHELSTLKPWISYSGEAFLQLRGILLTDYKGGFAGFSPPATSLPLSLLCPQLYSDHRIPLDLKTMSFITLLPKF